MSDEMTRGSGYFRALFDAFPAPTFVVDEDVRVLDANAAAPGLVGERTIFLHKLCGDMLRCVNCWKTGAACGTTEACSRCVVRRSVGDAFADDHAVRRRATILRTSESEIDELNLLVSASPFDHDGTRRVLLVLEDVSELTELRHIVPICAYCKKVRNDDDFWERVESYMSRYLNARFTHGICPECRKKHCPEQDA